MSPGAIFLSVVGFLAACWFALWTISKRLRYYVRDPVELVHQTGESVRSLVTVAVDGVPVAKPVALEIEFRNSGAQEIRAEDVEDPLTVHIEGAIFAAVVCEPPRFASLDEITNVESTSGTVVLTLGTVNRFDQFKLIVLLDGMPSHVAATCRIKGQTRKGLINARLRGARLRTGWAYISPLVFGPAGYYLVILADPASRVFAYVVGALTFALTALGAWGGRIGFDEGVQPGDRIVGKEQ